MSAETFDSAGVSVPEGPDRGGIEGVEFEFRDGEREYVAVSASSRLAARLASVMGPSIGSPDPYTYQLSDDAELGEALGTLQRTLADEFRPGLPSVVVPYSQLRLSGAMALSFHAAMARRLAGSANVVLLPRRLRTSRHLSEHIYDLVRSYSDAYVLGIGAEDHVIDAVTGKPAVDLDEFAARLMWSLEAIRRETDGHVIYVRTPPFGERTDAHGRVRYSAEAAAPYMAAADGIVTSLGYATFELKIGPSEQSEIDRVGPKGALDLRRRLADEVRTAIAAATSSRRGMTSPAGVQSEPPAVESRYRLPIAASIRLRRRRHRLRRPSGEAAYLACRGVMDQEGDEPERIRSNKPLGVLGGRNEFERSIQRSIVDRLSRAERPGRKRVLMIGDSIRMRIENGSGYGQYSYRSLAGVANLTHIPHNTGGTNAVLWNLANWLTCDPDVIFINAGLHDLARSADDEPLPAYNPIDRYAANLDAIVGQLERSKARTIIWGTSTPVQEAWHRVRSHGRRGSRIVRSNSDVRDYNEASIEVMRAHGVPVADLFGPLWERGLESVLLADGVHLDHTGAALLGRIVAHSVSGYL